MPYFYTEYLYILKVRIMYDSLSKEEDAALPLLTVYLSN